MRQSSELHKPSVSWVLRVQMNMYLVVKKKSLTYEFMTVKNIKPDQAYL